MAVEHVFVVNPSEGGAVFLGDNQDADANAPFTGPNALVVRNGVANVLDPTLIASPGNPPLLAPNNLFGGPGPNGNGANGFLSCVFAKTRTAANFTNPSIPPDIRDAVQFVLWDPARGARFSDVIHMRSIKYINQTPYAYPIPHIVAFNPRYSTDPAVPMPTLQGDVLTVRVTMDKELWEYSMPSMITSVVVPGGNVGEPATPLQLQFANFLLLENLLRADAQRGTLPPGNGGYLFNHFLSRQLSMATNFTQVVLVGNFRRQYPIDNYYMPGPMRFEVHLLEGFGTNVVYQNLMTQDGWLASLANMQAYVGVYMGGHPGHGNYEQVLWHERKSVTQEGHTNFTHFANPQRSNPFTAAQPQYMYDCVTIDYVYRHPVPGENTEKFLQKRLTIYYARNEDPRDVNVPVGDANVLVPGGVLPGVPPIFTWDNILDAGAVVPLDPPSFPAPVAASIGPVGNASYGPFNRQYPPLPIAPPAQSPNAAAFADDYLAGGNGSFIGLMAENIMD